MNRVAGWMGVLLASSVAAAADWPQFRGPGGSAVADTEKPPLEWSETQNIRWTVALPGRGLSSPVIVGNRLYLTACSGYRERRLHVLCFDPATGKKLWERQLTATGSTQCHPKTNMAAPTPVADAQGVVALFATGDLIALNPNGDLLWLRSLVGDYPDITNQVGMASSPALTREAVIVPMDSAGESFLAAISREDGRNLWKTPRPRDINWTTPLILNGAAGRRIVFQSAKGLDCYTLADGKALWSLPLMKSSSMASPVAVGVHQGDLIVLADELLRLKESAMPGQPPETVWNRADPPPGIRRRSVTGMACTH